MLTEFPGRPFTLRQALECGIPRHRVRAAVANGEVRRVFTNVYVPADIADTLETRAAAVALVVSPHQIVCDRTAAWLHGIDVFGLTDKEVLPPVELCALRGHPVADRVGTDGRTRDLLPRDVMEVQGVSVTTPLRTALDLACGLGRRRALGALDLFMRHHGVTIWEMRRELRRFFRRRGVVQARELVPLADPRAESMRESWLRLEIRDHGFPEPVPQFRVRLGGGGHYRIDLAYPAFKVAIEYNGEEWHNRTDEQRDDDRKRREHLVRLGWTVIVVDKDGLESGAWRRELQDALRPRTRRLRWARPA